jgi:prepilin-type N-terminal cleavage/methylation domain-containing protein
MPAGTLGPAGTWKPARSPRGMSLVELMFVVAILGVVVAGVTQAIVTLYRTNSVRNLNIRLQGEGRDALGRVEHVLRSASLGAPLGVLWTQDLAGGLVRRPAVQIYDNLNPNGDAGLPVKTGTDALLIVGAVSQGAEAAVMGTSFNSPDGIAVTDAAPFARGMNLLIGPYRSAAWETVTGVVAGPPGHLNLGSTANVFPDGKADSGSMVRQARAILYYVDTSDQLIEQELLVPRAPASLAEGGTQRILARGVENLQLDCDLDDGVAFQPCPAAIAAADPVAAEAAWAFGAWAGGGPRLNEGSIVTVRTVILSVVLRSEQPVRGGRGDDRITLEGTTPPVGLGGDDTQPYLRRAYRLPVAVRNVSLGAL